MFFSFCTLWFLFRPCFSLQSPCGFYSDRVFSKCYTKGSTVMRALRLAIPLWFLSGPRFSGIAPWGFYMEWGFCYPPPVVFIQAVVLQKLPMMFLFCPCAQSGTIEYLENAKDSNNSFIVSGTKAWGKKASICHLTKTVFQLHSRKPKEPRKFAP